MKHIDIEEGQGEANRLTFQPSAHPHPTCLWHHLGHSARDKKSIIPHLLQTTQFFAKKQVCVCVCVCGWVGG